MKVALIMGSKSDYEVVLPAIELFRQFEVEVEVRVLSAHRTTFEALEYTQKAAEEGISVIIAAAGKAAHLPGVLASVTELPVIGLPIQTSLMGGMDSLFSIVQMPKGIPVLTVAVNGAENAALGALRIMALQDPALREKYRHYVARMKADVLKQDEAVRQLTQQ